MRSSCLPPLILVAMMVIACGCTNTVPAADPTTGVTAPPATTPATPAPAPSETATPVPPADPIVGNWIGYQYIASGRVEKTWTFRENNTWTMTNRNVKSQKKKVVNGRWTRTGAATYRAAPEDGAPDTFTYNATSDRLSDTYFQGTYYRYSGTLASASHPPALEVVINSAQSVNATGTAHPLAGNRFLIVNCTVTNRNETVGYVVSDGTTWVTSPDGQEAKSINQKIEGNLENPFPAGKIATGESRQGNLIFGVPASARSFRICFTDTGGNVISGVIETGDVWTNETYSSTPGR